MIINQDTQEVENLEEFKSKSFGFHKSAKAFQLIIKNIYSNPVKSALAEIIQNARDAHILANKQDTQFEIHLPSRLNPEFKVVDFGIGLSHKFMMEKYTLAFYSSKDKNAEMAGGFGCGRLSVLALTSTYNVISVCNGKRYYYSIFINSEGEPEIVTINHEETSDCNGFTVSCPVLPEHVPQFQEEAKRILKYWKIKPIIKNVDNFVIPPITKEIEGANWMIVKELIYTAPQVVAGIYSYDVNMSNIPNLNEQQTAILQSSGLVLFMGASDVSPQVNRQGLTYDNKTIKNIKATLDCVVNDVGGAIQREFDKCASSWDAKLLYHKYFNSAGVAKNIGKLLGEKYKVKWQGLEIEDTVFELTEDENKHIKIISYYQRYARGGNYTSDCAAVGSIVVSDATRLYINDLDNPNMGVMKRMRYIMNNARRNGSVIEPFVVSFENAAAEKLFFEKTLLTPANLASIKAIEVVSDGIARDYNKNSKHTNKVFKFDYSSNDRYKKSDSWEEIEIDVEEDEGIYIQINKFIPSDFLFSNNSLNETLEALKFFKLWSDDDILIGIKNNYEEIKEFTDNPNWKTFRKYLEDCVAQLALTDEELQKMADHNFFNQFDCSFKYDNGQYLNTLSEKLGDSHIISKYCDLLKNFTQINQNYREIELKVKFMTKLGRTVANTKKPSIDIEKVQKKLIRLYPFLFDGNTYYNIKNYHSFYFDYVRGVDFRLAETQDQPF